MDLEWFMHQLTGDRDKDTIYLYPWKKLLGFLYYDHRNWHTQLLTCYVRSIDIMLFQRIKPKTKEIACKSWLIHLRLLLLKHERNRRVIKITVQSSIEISGLQIVLRFQARILNIGCSCIARTAEGSTRQCGFPAKFIEHLALDVSQILNTPPFSASLFLLLASPPDRYHSGMASWCCPCS